jgi:hypothetical protein
MVIKLIWLFLISFLIGCASAFTVLRLEDRELLIHPDKPGLAFPYNHKKCIERRRPWRWLGKKCFTSREVVFYDFNKKEERKLLIDKGFTCKSKLRFRY